MSSVVKPIAVFYLHFFYLAALSVFVFQYCSSCFFFLFLHQPFDAVADLVAHFLTWKLSNTFATDLPTMSTSTHTVLCSS